MSGALEDDHRTVRMSVPQVRVLPLDANLGIRIILPR